MQGKDIHADIVQAMLHAQSTVVLSRHDTVIIDDYEAIYTLLSHAILVYNRHDQMWYANHIRNHTDTKLAQQRIKRISEAYRALR
jgi:hypothetical protein